MERILGDILKRLEILEDNMKNDLCPICYGHGYYDSPSKELEMFCDVCNGTGRTKKDGVWRLYSKEEIR